MAGNRNSGRRPKPPTPEDYLSELIWDLRGQLIEMEAADQKHGREQHDRRRAACDTVSRISTGWRDLRGLYPKVNGGQVVSFPTDRMAA